MSTNKSIFLITAGLVIVSGFIIMAFERKYDVLKEKSSKGITIEKTWELPKNLKEVSGIDYLGNQRVACVQDEDGIIFIYDLKTEEINKRIPFGPSGDYEGLAVAGNTAYVVRSDGTIFEISNFTGETKVRKYQTRLSRENDVEGLFYDKRANRLLLAIKGKDPDSKNYKGIYGFDLEKKQLEEKPVYKLTFQEKVFQGRDRKNIQELFKPSDLVLRRNGNVLILEAQEPQLLELKASGVAKTLHRLNSDQFPQPEGITIDSEGKILISNEGNPATIHQVTVE